MTIARSDEQRLFRDSLRKFLQTENDFEHRRRRLSAAHPERLALWPGLADLGVLGGSSANLAVMRKVSATSACCTHRTRPESR